MGLNAEKDAPRQVWCVVYDSPNPSMGGPVPIRMADQHRETAERNYAFLLRQETTSPKRNLRIETRFVTEWTRVTPPAVGREARP